MYTRPNRKENKNRRHLRVRKKVMGTTERPRLNIYKSLNNIYAQVIDDIQGVTVTSASTLSPELKGQLSSSSNMEAAVKVGELVAKKAQEKGVKQVIFDRGGYLYHGKIKALADAAREAGLQF